MKLELAEHLSEKRGWRTRGRDTSDEGRAEPEHGPPVSPLTMICTVQRVARSSVYATGTPATPADRQPRKRGPKTTTSDIGAAGRDSLVLATTPFHGEGYRGRGLRLRCDMLRCSATAPWALLIRRSSAAFRGRGALPFRLIVKVSHVSMGDTLTEQLRGDISIDQRHTRSSP
jgi:hypothetical protein